MLAPLLQWFAAACTTHTFLGIPPWYKYLVMSGRMAENPDTKVCELVETFKWKDGGDLTLIALGLLDMALRISAFVAVGFMMYGAIQYITSDGQPDKTKEAQQTIINALIGLIIALIATASVSFLGRTLSA